MGRPDSFFGPPYSDVDEQRSAPLPHRYVHGGFEGTDTRFSFYFLPPEQYRGRFFQWLEGGPGGHEHEAAQMLDFPFAQGAYVVESNQGHLGLDPGPPDPTITTYRASEASARYARELATDMYGEVPHHGYLWGGSGGGFRTIMGLENVGDVWTGGVPFVSGGGARMRPQSLSSAAANVMRALGPRLAEAVDALEPGGSGDPFATLDADEREALAALFEAGFSPGGLFQLARPSVESLLIPMMLNGIRAMDSAYFEDFWTAAGHAGADGKLASVLVDDKATIRRVLQRDELVAKGLVDPALLAANSVAPSLEMVPLGIVIDGEAPANTRFASIRLTSGRATGSELNGFGTVDGVVVTSAPGKLAGDVAPGDEVSISNRDFLAFCHHHRYSEQRGATGMGFGVPMTGNFTGKMILVNSTLDGLVPVAAGIGYAELVREELGDATDRSFRLWWTDNAGHVPGMAMPQGDRPVVMTRLVNYMGMNQQAMLDLIDWVEHDREPPASTAYSTEEGRFCLPASADERRGIQPVVSATANGAARAEVKTGAPVELRFVAEAPPGAGAIITAEWDFDGSGAFGFAHDGIDGSARRIALSTTHTFDAPGTYFPAVRVHSHRDGDVQGRYGRIENLARVRVVVA